MKTYIHLWSYLAEFLFFFSSSSSSSSSSSFSFSFSFFKKAIFACSSQLYNLGCSCKRRLPAVRPLFWWSFWCRLVFGLASLTSLMSRCSALLSCSFRAFLLLLTDFTTSCKLHRYRMSMFFVPSNLVLPRMALEVLISVVLKGTYLKVK